VKKLGLLKTACIAFVFCAATAIGSPAQVLTTLHGFSGADGQAPVAGLVQARDGNFYGTTAGGGASGNCLHGCGTVFKITLQGALTTLYSFNGSDGAGPTAKLVQASDGNFYGTTQNGGANDQGTVFEITPSGTLTTLYSFCSQVNCPDGAHPYAGLIQARDGNFYGTTPYGGTGCPYGCGTVFEITPSGALSTLHSFNGSDGASPYAGLVQASDGDFYGTSSNTVFKITPSGALTTLHSFNGSDGDEAVGELVQASDRNFYGTTVRGGGSNDWCHEGCGTVFKITPEGALTVLYRFGYTDGAYPYAGLVQASDGNFYGTTSFGGVVNFEGTVFKITPSGALTTLYSFCSRDNCSDGAQPQAGLVQASDGNFYGATAGVSDCSLTCGTVFRLVTLRACIVCPSLE